MVFRVCVTVEGKHVTVNSTRYYGKSACYACSASVFAMILCYGDPCDCWCAPTRWGKRSAWGTLVLAYSAMLTAFLNGGGQNFGD